MRQLDLGGESMGCIEQAKYVLFGSVCLQPCGWGLQLTIASFLFSEVVLVPENCHR